MRNRPLVPLLLVGALASAAGIAIGFAIDWFPRQGSAQADKVDTLYNVLLVASVPMFVLVATMVLYCVWQFRMRPGEEEKDGPPIHGNTRLEVIWTTLPFLLILSLCSYAYVVLRDFERTRGSRMDVDVNSQQFAWSFQYPRSVTGGQPLSSTSLYLPLGRQIQFHIHSRDVIHAFYVPSFRLQIDAVPGQTTELRATPNRIGTYDLECAELCGLGHAAMRSAVHVVSAADFQAWLRRQGAPGTGGATGSATATASRPAKGVAGVR